MLSNDDMDGADDALWHRCALVSSFTVSIKKFYLYASHVENVGTSKSAIFLNTLYFILKKFCPTEEIDMSQVN